MGVTVERVWHQTTPQGDLAIVYEEADDLAQGLSRLAASQEPFDVWFKQQVLEMHGVDFNQPLPGPLPELLFDWVACDVWRCNASASHRQTSQATQSRP